MADITKDDVIEFISNMSVLELSELVSEMEEKFGVSAAAPVAMGDRPLAELEPADRNGYFDAPPDMALDPDAYYYATLVTDKGDYIGPISAASPLANRQIADIEREAILCTLEATRGNKTEAARRLGLTARTLSNKMKIWKQAGLVA